LLTDSTAWTVIGNCHVLIIFASREYSRKGRFFCHNKGICRRCRQLAGIFYYGSHMLLLVGNWCLRYQPACWTFDDLQLNL